ncbi:MAG: 30S ribosomal protein S16 [Deltaproteobacteria bacterium]|nr:30S ribosomal protein S16 [Deltaproteobacteria bacterium]
MVKIRLTRMGSKKKPFYRLVAIDSRVQRDGGFLEILGHYNPHTDPVEVRLKPERIIAWIQQGARPTDTVKSLLRKEGIWQKLSENKAA